MNVRKRLTILSIFTLSCGMAGAALAAGNADAGKNQAVTCAACHGQDGATGLDGTYPNLAGQNEKYLLHQLKAIQADTRAIPLMAGQLAGKSEQDLADLAAYYASLPIKVGQASGNDEQLSKAAQIYRGGIARKGVAACTACHSPSGLGNTDAGFPVLSGQPKAYVVAQLKAYREAQRSTDANFGGMMRGVAEGLTDTEIDLLADYIRGLY